MAYQYDVMIVMDIEFSGGSARGSGGASPGGGASHWGGAGYEVQVISVICQTPCAQRTLCQRALAQARNAVLQAGIRYNWQSQGLRVKTVSCDVIQETRI